MEVQQASCEQPVAPAALGADAAASAQRSKTDVDEAPVDAVMLQPAAPTLDVASSTVGTPHSTAALSSESAASHAHQGTKPMDAGDADLNVRDSSFHTSDGERISDVDAAPGVSRSADVQVAPLAFGPTPGSGQRESGEAMHTPPRVEQMSDDTPQRLHDSAAAGGVDDLISLPSPVAALSLDANAAGDEPSTSRDALTIQSTERESDDHDGYESDWDADAADASEQTLVETVESPSTAAHPVGSPVLAVASADEGDAVASWPSQERQSESASSVASPVASAPASPLAAASATESSDAEEAAEQPPPPAPVDVKQSSEAEQPTFSFTLDATAAEAESPVKARVNAADRSPPPKELATDSPVKSQLQRSPAPAAGREARTPGNDLRASSNDAIPRKANRAAKTSSSSSSETKDSSASSKEAKPKNGRVTNPPAAAPRAKASDSMKVKAPPPAPTRATVAKSKSSSSASTSGAPATKAGPSAKAKVDASSGSQTRERGGRVASNKSPVPAAPGLSKREVSTATGKTKANSITPPPAPTSLEQEGPKSVKKRLSSSELEAASNRLYSDALEAKKRKEVLKAELEESFTFTPQVNATKRHVVPDEKNRFVLLHEKAMEAAKRKEELRQKREKAECTFKPKITAKAKKLTAKSTKPRYENLYQQAHEIKQKREEKKNEIEQKAVDECSFKPKIKTMKSPTKSRPLYDAERLKQKKLALEQKKIEAELSECTFKPKVVANKATKSKSDDAGGGKSTGGDAKLYDRLYQASQKRAENLEKLRLEREEQVKAVATFHPKITSSGSTKSGAAGATKQPFHERLYSKDHMQKVTADREQKKLEEVQKFSFKPQITAVPDEIKSKQSSASNSPDKSIFERLYDEKDRVKEKIEMSEALKKQNEMVGCTFHPQIETSPSHPPKSDKPIWERLLSYDKNQVLEEREKMRQELEMQECTFKPEVTPSEYFTPSKSPSTGIFDRLTTGAVSMPSSEMKRRESERKGFGSVQHKRRSVPEFAAFKEQPRTNAIGAILTSSNIVMTPESAPASASANPSRGATVSLSLPSAEPAATLEQTKHEDAVSSLPPTSNGESLAAAKARGAELLLDDRTGPEDAVGGVANNTDEHVAASHGQAILDNYDSWASDIEEKMRRLA